MNAVWTGPVRVLAVAPYEAMAASLQRCAESFPDTQLDVVIGDLESGLAIVRKTDLSLYDAILSRGGTADLIRAEVDLPVVEIPVQVYDVLRILKLAENYTDQMAIVGFPAVTENAHTLCNLLRLDYPIETVHDSRELIPLLGRLRARGIHTLICDMVTHTVARSEGFQALLITSGENSLEQAIRNAEMQGRSYRNMQGEVLLLRGLLGTDLAGCVVLNRDRDLVWSFSDTLPEGLLSAMRRQVSAVPDQGELLFHHQEAGILHAVTVTAARIRGQKYFLFRDQPGRIPLKSLLPGIRSYDRAECEQLFKDSFFTLTGSMGELEPRLNALASGTHPLMIIGEAGTGREQIARTLYLRSSLKNHPLVAVDGSSLGDRGWNYLTEGSASPLGGRGTAVFFHNMEELPPHRQQQLLSLIEDTGLTQRLWLLFACNEKEGQPMSSFTRELSLRLGAMTLHVPPLRGRRDEIPALASLYLARMNLDLGKQVAGFEPGALDALVRYDWPGNYTQFKHVLQEITAMTDGLYISAVDLAELLARERDVYRQTPQTLPDFIGEGLTLEEITLEILRRRLAANRGNQSLTARQLGIGRSTLWRMLSRSPVRSSDPPTSPV